MSARGGFGPGDEVQELLITILLNLFHDYGYTHPFPLFYICLISFFGVNAFKKQTFTHFSECGALEDKSILSL